MAWGTLLLVLVAAGALLALLVTWRMAIALLRPPRMSDAKATWVLNRATPRDIGLDYEDCLFTVRDEQTGRPLRIAGWWIGHPSALGRCVVMLHGYADAKVGAIAWAPVFHELGWNILAIDLRAHGASAGENCTQGYFERHDVCQIVNQLRINRPDDARRIVLFGASMGGAVAAATAAVCDDLAGLILDSTAASSNQAVLTTMRFLGAPGGPLPRLSLRLAQWIASADLGAVQPADSLRRVRCPVLLIAGQRDHLVDDAQWQRLRDAAPAGSEFWRPPDAAHMMSVVAAPDEYRRRIGEFLQRVGVMP